MDFDFSDDQEQLRDAVRKWVDKGYDFERRRKTVAAGGFDRAAYNELAELGLAGLYISEADGGMGMGPVEGMVVMEELGRGIVMEPLTQTLIAGGVLSGYGSDALKAQCLPKIASGETLVVLAYQERKARYRLDVCEAKATQSSAGWSLSATKNMVLQATRLMHSSCRPPWTARSPCSWSNARPAASRRAATAPRMARAPLTCNS
jgi:alkylation response protein AidB-like acyl-CoA dehydrogenase